MSIKIIIIIMIFIVIMFILKTIKLIVNCFVFVIWWWLCST